jgi:hypothetical protein
MVYGIQIEFNRIINIQIMSSWNWIQTFLITCGISLGLIWYMLFFPFNSSKICKISCIPHLLFGSPYKKQMSWKLNVYYLIAIHCNQTMTKHAPINGNICHVSIFNDKNWTYLSKTNVDKQPMSLFNIILLTLKIGNLLTIYQHENALKNSKWNMVSWMYHLYV